MEYIKQIFKTGKYKGRLFKLYFKYKKSSIRDLILQLIQLCQFICQHQDTHVFETDAPEYSNYQSLYHDFDLHFSAIERYCNSHVLSSSSGERHISTLHNNVKHELSDIKKLTSKLIELDQAYENINNGL